MNVGELKQRLIGVSDDVEVVLVIDNGIEAWWRMLDERRVGFRGALATLLDPPPEDFRDKTRLHSWVSFAGVMKAQGRLTTIRKEPIMEFQLSNGNHCPSLLKEEREEVARQIEAPTQRQLSAGQGIVKR